MVCKVKAIHSIGQVKKYLLALLLKNTTFMVVEWDDPRFIIYFLMKKQPNNQKYKSTTESIALEDPYPVSHSYTLALAHHEKFAQEISTLHFLRDKIPHLNLADKHKYSTSNKKERRTIHLLMNGENPHTFIKVRVMRILHWKEVSLLVVCDEEAPHRTDRFIHLALVSEEEHDPSTQTEEVDLIMANSVITVFHPFKRTDKVEQIHYLISRSKNVRVMNLKVFPTHEKMHQNTHEAIKTYANGMYKEKRYMQALTNYELALSYITKYSMKKERAIIYSNTSACLYELRLFSASLQYAEIACIVDSSYPKGFFRKLSSHLQLGMYSAIPNSLMKLGGIIKPEEYDLQSQKYLNYIASSIGVFNWKDLLINEEAPPEEEEKKESQVCQKTTSAPMCVIPICPLFGEYTSPQVQLCKYEKAYFYQSTCDIEPYSLILVNKPLLYTKLSSEALPNLIAQASRFSKIQRSFYDDLRALPCRCHPSGLECKLDEFDNQNQYFFSQKQVGNKVHWCIRSERNFKMPKPWRDDKYRFGFEKQPNGKENRKRAKEGHNIGIWSKLHNFKHDCLSNCTFLHLKSGLFVFSSKKIPKHSPLTLDFLSDIEVKSRKNSLLEKYNRKCECVFCSFPWDQDIFGTANLSKQAHSLSLSKVKKAVLKSFIGSLPRWSYEKEQTIVISVKLYLEEVLKQPCWEDATELLRLLSESWRTEWAGKIQFVLQKIIQRYSKVSEMTAKEILKAIIQK